MILKSVVLCLIIMSVTFFSFGDVMYDNKFALFGILASLLFAWGFTILMTGFNARKSEKSMFVVFTDINLRPIMTAMFVVALIFLFPLGMAIDWLLYSLPPSLITAV